MPRNIFEIKREGPFAHFGPNGTSFCAKRCDLKGGVEVLRPRRISDEQFAADVFSCSAYWATNIYANFREDGQGFMGFDTVKFDVQKAD